MNLLKYETRNKNGWKSLKEHYKISNNYETVTNYNVYRRGWVGRKRIKTNTVENVLSIELKLYQFRLLQIEIQTTKIPKRLLLK